MTNLIEFIKSNDITQAILGKVRSLNENSLVNGYVTITKNQGKENEIIIVPGKVLGSGMLNHKLTISAYQFSEQAKDKIEKANSKIIPLLDLSKDKPNGKRIRIIG